MRLVSRIFVVCVFLAGMLAYATIHKEVVAANASRAEIVADEQAGTIKLMVDGKPVALIDATGFYVRGNIAYSGTIVDGLPEQFRGEGASNE